MGRFPFTTATIAGVMIAAMPAVVGPDLTEAAGAGQYTLPGTDLSVPRIQIVTIEQAMELRDRAVRVPLVQASHKRAAREVDGAAQGALDF